MNVGRNKVEGVIKTVQDDPAEIPVDGPFPSAALTSLKVLHELAQCIHPLESYRAVRLESQAQYEQGVKRLRNIRSVRSYGIIISLLDR